MRPTTRTKSTLSPSLHLSPMADSGLTVVDGAQLRSPGLHLPIPDGALTGAQLIDLASSAAADRLYGLSLPEPLRSAALRRLHGGDVDAFLSSEFADPELVKKMAAEYFIALADRLKDDPLVISVLDGSALRLFLDDEDDFAMMAEDLFTELDIDDNGKLNKNDMRKALEHMGVVMGVPPFSESGDLLNGILQKHGAEGEGQLGQAQFAQLLQPILQDLADALAEKPVVVVQNIKVANGSKLKQILADETILEGVIGKIFEEWVVVGKGEGNKGMLRSFLEAKGLELGLPPLESNVAAVLLYDQVFSSIAEGRIAGDLSKDTFIEVVEDIFKMFAEQLEADPMFIDWES